MSLLDDMNDGGGWRMPGAPSGGDFVRGRPMTRIPASRLARTGLIRKLGFRWRSRQLQQHAHAPTACASRPTSAAYLTSPDPSLDIMPGDRIQALPDDGRRWEVSGYPSRDANAFTSWQPTIEIPLSEYRG